MINFTSLFFLQWTTCLIYRAIFSPIDITVDNHESPSDDIDADLYFYN